jgi:type I restriction enzyme M protein
VPKAEIAAKNYDLSLNKYKEVVHEEVEYDAPEVILDRIKAMEREIMKGIEELRGMVGHE